MSDHRGTCRSCPAEVLWARMPSGKPNPLDLEPTELRGVGVVAFNPATGGGKALTQADIDAGLPAEWADHGVTFHLSHFATCPNAARHKGKARGDE